MTPNIDCVIPGELVATDDPSTVDAGSMLKPEIGEKELRPAGRFVAILLNSVTYISIYYSCIIE
jgi:hypothetical protein